MSVGGPDPLRVQQPEGSDGGGENFKLRTASVAAVGRINKQLHFGRVTIVAVVIVGREDVDPLPTYEHKKCVPADSL